jgi:thiol-disulfide isomerase/thioredoxin
MVGGKMMKKLLLVSGFLLLLCVGFSKKTVAEDRMFRQGVYQAITQHSEWLNTNRALAPDDLQGRVILLDFWTFCCINCIHVIPDLKYLEKHFGDKLTVIGVHSAKFTNEKDTVNIRNAILRYGIEHPVVNDFDFSTWQQFNVHSWPTFILIAPDGRIVRAYSGEGHREELEEDIDALLTEYDGKINTSSLPVALERDKVLPTYLSFPGKVTSDGERLFISDSGHHRIVVATLDGDVETIIGSGKEGLKDGSFMDAQFRRPQGMALLNNVLYVADTENHAIRKVDLQTKTVSTIAGTGEQGYERIVKDAPAIRTNIASPWDIAVYPDKQHLTIAMAGTHQLWIYNIADETLSVLAGNGRESIDDGRYPFNSLSQPSGLTVSGRKLYFVDSETSSLRVFDDSEVETLIGSGLFDFGYADGRQGEAMMQHPLGLYATGEGVYIADSYNHSIRRYNSQTKVLSTFAGNGTSGDVRGGSFAQIRFNEPGGITEAGRRFYVADTNNNRIVRLDVESGKADVLPVKEKSGYHIAEHLPNMDILPSQDVEAEAPINVSIALSKGWKINKDAPSYLAIFDGEGLVFSVEKDVLRHMRFELPPFSKGRDYRLQATLYYCEDKDGAECLIKSFDQTLHTKTDGEKSIAISLEP